MTYQDIESRFIIRKLPTDEQICHFDCKDDDLNDFIINDAPAYRKAMLAVTYLLEESETGKVAAYFSIANDRIGLLDFPEKRDFNRFRKHKFVNEKRLKSYPAAKICRLAIDADYKGKGIGSYLLKFIKTYYIADDKAGCRFLTVDAYTDAVQFYLKNDFVTLSEGDATSKTRLLYFDLNDLTD